jgi:hypothetical protein
LDFSPVVTSGQANVVNFSGVSSVGVNIVNDVADHMLVVSGNGLSDPLLNVDRVVFSDQSVAYDLGVGQSGGEAALLVSATLGLSGLSNKALLGTTIKAFDGGQTMTGEAQSFINSGLISTSNVTNFVSTLWQNVVGTPIDQADLSLFTVDLANGTFTQASLLGLAATCAANQAHINLVGMPAHGLDYIPA